MRAREFIIEGSIAPDVSDALPGALVIPSLKNNDFYEQYRFGVAIAAARGGYDAAPATIGENEMVVAYGGEGDVKVVDDALRMIGKAGTARRVSGNRSQEGKSVETNSPVKGFKGYQCGPKKK